MRGLIFAGALVAAVAVSAPAAGGPRLAGKPLVDALRKGGYVVFIRHGEFHGSMARTGCGRTDRLTERARQEAASIHAAVAALAIPVGYVASAPECVPLEAARAAFGKADATRDLALLNRARTRAERGRLTRALRKLLSTRPPSGLNTFVVGHLSNIRATAKLSLAASEAAVFRPRGNGRFSLVARIAVGEWTKLVDAQPWREWSVAAGSHPHDVAPSADGKTVYYTAQLQESLGILDVTTGRWRHVGLGRGAAPHGVIVGPDGDAWITEQGLNELIRFDPKTQRLQRYEMPRANTAPHTAAFAPNGILWFTGSGGFYGRLDPKSGKVDVWPAPRGQGPYGITVTPDGTPYYVSLAGHYLGRVNPRTGAVTVLEPPTRNQGARRVWTDSKNRVWVTYWDADKLGMYDPERGWREWDLPGRSQPYAVYVDDEDIVWVTDFASNAFVRFDPKTERFTTFRIPSANALVRQLLGIPGQVWGAESARDKIVLLRTAA